MEWGVYKYSWKKLCQLNAHHVILAAHRGIFGTWVVWQLGDAGDVPILTRHMAPTPGMHEFMAEWRGSAFFGLFTLMKKKPYQILATLLKFSKVGNGIE